MVLNTAQAWVTKSEPEIFLGQEKEPTHNPRQIKKQHSQGLSSPNRRLHVLDFLMDMPPFIPLKYNVHLSSSKKHELICGCSPSNDWNIIPMTE